MFISLLAFCVPANIFADEGITEVTGEDASVVLYATIPSHYTVKLPARVDVTAVSTEFDVFAKGSIAADKKLDVVVAQGEHTLRDNTTGSSRSYPLTVSVTDGSFAAADLQNDYQDDLKSLFTIGHAELMAGDYTYNLPILIALNDIN